MSIWATIKIALKAINANKLRAFLTMLGIIIGVSSVIVLVSIGQGASKAIEDKISALGTNLLIVVPRAVTINGVRQGVAKTLTLDDCYSIENECVYVKYASPNINGTAQVVYGNQNWNAVFDGVSKDYETIGNWSVAEGEFFTEEDVENANQVCLIGNTVLEELFNGEDPIDQFIRVKNIPFRII
ncbi:ABC transporter permease, partial [bacterium]|nr:ABC transporter permease [bacterium]